MYKAHRLQVREHVVLAGINSIIANLFVINAINQVIMIIVHSMLDRYQSGDFYLIHV